MKIKLENADCIKYNRVLRDIIIEQFLDEFLPDYKEDLVLDNMIDSNRLAKYLTISRPVLLSKVSQYKDEIKGYKFIDDNKFKEFKKKYSDKGLITSRIAKYNFKLFNKEEVLRLLLLFNGNYRDRAFDLLVNKYSDILYLSEKTEMKENESEDTSNLNIGFILDSLNKFPKQTAITLLQTFNFKSSDNVYINSYVSKLLDGIIYSVDLKSYDKTFLKYQLEALANNKSCNFSEENLKRIYEYDGKKLRYIFELELFKCTE